MDSRYKSFGFIFLAVSAFFLYGFLTFKLLEAGYEGLPIPLLSPEIIFAIGFSLFLAILPISIHTRFYVFSTFSFFHALNIAPGLIHDKGPNGNFWTVNFMQLGATYCTVIVLFLLSLRFLRLAGLGRF